MQSVGEAMAIGRTFPESLQKGLRSLEHGRLGLNCDPGGSALRRSRTTTSWCAGRPSPPRTGPSSSRPRSAGASPSSACTRRPGSTRGSSTRSSLIVERTGPADRARRPRRPWRRADWRRAKRLGFADAQLAWLWGVPEAAVRAARLAAGCGPPSRRSTPARAEFEAHTPVPLLDLRGHDEVRAGDRPKIIILGSGPNRIGQGVEFDYCCVQASFALHDAGFETVMINCNPETVSTDYDTSDRLYFEPLTCGGREQRPRRRDRRPARSPGSSSSLGGPDPAQAGRPATRRSWSSGPRRSRSTWPRIGSAGTPCAPGSGSPSRPGAPRRLSTRPGPSRTGSATRRWCGRATCSVGGPWRSSTTTTTCRRAMDELGRVRLARPGRRPVGRAAGAGRPVPGGRHRGRRRRRARPRPARSSSAR